MAASSPMQPHLALRQIDTASHSFAIPAKKINVLPDVRQFLTSPAYDLITSFIIHLNASVSPLDQETNALRSPAGYILTSPKISVSSEVQNIIDLIHTLEGFIDQAPPDPGPRRFGNVACRKWHILVQEALSKTDGGLLDKHLPAKITSLEKQAAGVSAKEELLPYLLGSFGSPQRLDYGTGHELSFAAFLCGIWVLGGFQPGRDEVALTLKCFDAYFHLIRRLVLTYTLEPAGSHGVWGLDDHSFLPYIFGSAQLTTYPPTSDATAVDPPAREGIEGLEDVPKPGDVVKNLIVERERLRNLYFGAVGFIYDVKTGPFWEHSPILYDISGVQGGWGKINKGMLKMYNAEVLGKFPVVQHFPFGSIFRWGVSGFNATTRPPHSINAQTGNFRDQAVGASPITTAPWANRTFQHSTTTSMPDVTTRVPWANSTSQPSNRAPVDTTRAPWVNGDFQQPVNMSGTTTGAPWAKPPSGTSSELKSPFPSTPESILTSKPGGQPTTIHAPWSAPQQPTYPILAGMNSARPLPQGQLDGEDTKAPWAMGNEGRESPPLIQQATEANLGPRRTSSPDSKLAASLDSEEAAKRRGSLGTGGVRVAESGDLKRRQPSVGDE